MKAYQLLARLRLLTLAGINKYGDLEWIGTNQMWGQISNEEDLILVQWELNKI